MRFVLDAAQSPILLRTKAEGLLSRVAHDLEIEAEGVTGEGEDGEPSRARLRVPVAAMRVVGVVRRGEVDESVLSEADRRDIERRIREDVFRGVEAIEVDGELVGNRLRARVRVGRGREQPVESSVEAMRAPERVKVQGSLSLSLRSLGLQAPKGPMGAFRVADRVEVRFDARFVASQSQSRLGEGLA